MTLYRRFEEAMSAWVTYCEQPEVLCSSDPRKITDCQPYRDLRRLGRPALPLIRELCDRQENGQGNAWRKIKGVGLAALVQDITRSHFRIPDNLQGDDLERHTTRWLDVHLEEYVSGR